MSLCVEKSNVSGFSPIEDELLVEMVRENPPLYDLRLEAYKDVLIKENIWKDIARTLNKTSDECKKKWKYIKDSYNRYKHKQKSGTGSAAHKRSKFDFYEKLQFLELPSSQREGKSNVPTTCSENLQTSSDVVNADDNSDEEDDDLTQLTVVDENHSTSEVQTPIENEQNTPQIAPKRKRRTKQDTFLEYMKKRDAQRQILLNKSSREKIDTPIDDVGSFGQHITAVLRKLPPILQIKAKTDMLSLLSKYELRALEIANRIPLTDSTIWATTTTASSSVPSHNWETSSFRSASSASGTTTNMENTPWSLINDESSDYLQPSATASQYTRL